MTICYQSIMDQYHLNKPNNALTFVISVFFFLLLTAPSVLAQETNYNPNNNTTTTSTSFNLTFALIFLALIVLFIVTAFLIVFFSCGGPNSATTANPTARTTIDENGPQWVIPVVRQLGLDKSVLDTFPIIKFSEIKGLNPGTLECAVCLSEYDDSDTLRILPGCCHVFHPECIDNWLSNHDICPVCRASLTNPNIIFTESQLETGNGSVITEDERYKMSISMKGTDRFTLRLPEHVLRDIEIHRGYKLSASIAGSGYQGTPMSKSGRVWAFIRTFSSRRGQQLGAGSRSIRLGGSLRRNLTLGRNSSIREVAPVRSGSVRARVDDVASSMVPVQSGSLRGQANAVASGIVLMRSASVGGQTNMVRAEPVRSGSVRVQTHMVISSMEPSARSGSFRGQTDMVASSTEPVLSGSVRGRADMVPIHEFDQV